MQPNRQKEKHEKLIKILICIEDAGESICRSNKILNSDNEHPTDFIDFHNNNINNKQAAINKLLRYYSILIFELASEVYNQSQLKRVA